MSKKIARRLALVLALTLTAAPATQLLAQSGVITGGDPEPTGEPDIVIFSIASALGLA